MKKTLRILLACFGAWTVAGFAYADQATPTIGLVATYDTGLGVNGAEIISVREGDGLAVLTNVAGSVDVIDFSDPVSPALLRRVTVDPAFGTPNSAAIHPRLDFFLVVSGSAGQQGTVAAYRLSDGELLGTAVTGIQPDSIAISPNGRYAVVANEAEGTGTGQNGGEGSLSIVHLGHLHGAWSGALVVTNVALPSQAGVAGFSNNRTDDIGRLPIDNTPGTLEPESVTFSHNSRFAYVTLQENNAVVRLEVHSGELAFFGLGETTHAADLDTAGGYVPDETLTAFREPDGIALDRTGRFFVTADEGDSRGAAGTSGPRGGRTVSVFNARTGAFIADTGSQLDDAAAEAGIYPDARSNRGGSEPEVLDMVHVRGRDLVAVGLERANAIALIDVSDPAKPTVVALAAVGAAPEGVRFLKRRGQLFLLTANEVAGTVSVLKVGF